MSTSVRFANPVDANILAALRWQSRGADEQALEGLADFAPRFSAWYSAAISSGAWHVAVAIDEQENLAGCMYMRVVDTVPVPGNAFRAWGYVTHAFVSEGRRNHGLGHDMLALLVQKARLLQLKELQVWPSIGAVSLYVRAGFQSPERQRAGDAPDEPSYVLPLGPGA